MYLRESFGFELFQMNSFQEKSFLFSPIFGARRSDLCFPELKFMCWNLGPASKSHEPDWLEWTWCPATFTVPQTVVEVNYSNKASSNQSSTYSPERCSDLYIYFSSAKLSSLEFRWAHLTPWLAGKCLLEFLHFVFFFFIFSRQLTLCNLFSIFFWAWL